MATLGKRKRKRKRKKGCPWAAAAGVGSGPAAWWELLGPLRSPRVCGNATVEASGDRVMHDDVEGFVRRSYVVRRGGRRGLGSRLGD